MARLHQLAVEHDMLGKGFLGVALVVTDAARQRGLPLDAGAMLAKGGAQVRGASGARVKRLLGDLGITRRLTAEGGRTSRGGPAKMRVLVEFLNANASEIDLDEVMSFWAVQVQAFFNSQPFAVALDPANSIRSAIRTLAAAVEGRQRELAGATVLGTVIQHLVGAKIEIALGAATGSLARHGASVSDQAGRSGDIEIGDTVIHVTTTPGGPLIEKCAANLAAGKRPVIVTGRTRLAAAESLAEDAGLGARIDVFDFEGFLAANVFEIGRFEAAGRRNAFAAILDRYNKLIEAREGDPSLRIELR